MSDIEEMYEIVDKTDRPHHMPISITQIQQTRNNRDMTMSLYSRGLTSEKFKSVQPMSESEEERAIEKMNQEATKKYLRGLDAIENILSER